MNKQEIGNINIENARIMFKNFSGREEKFNPVGRRNFCVVIEDEKMAQQLALDGWKIKQLKPRDEGDSPVNYIQVTVSYKNFPPKIWLITSQGKKTLLDEDSVGTLDWAEITKVDLIIRPYPWEVNGAAGIKAYVKTMYVTIQEDVFEEKYAGIDDCPF